MITADSLIKIGSFIKPHGIKGELTAESDEFDLVDLISGLRCIIVDFDGIYVPFFVDGSRSRSKTIALLHIEGVANENEAKAFAGKTIFALADELPEFEDPDIEGNDEIYASDLVGYEVWNGIDRHPLGVIADYDDSTDNVILIVDRPGGKPLYIPFVPEFFLSLDEDKKIAEFNLPTGLTDL